jgi:hypothetical protein
MWMQSKHEEIKPAAPSDSVGCIYVYIYIERLEEGFWKTWV